MGARGPKGVAAAAVELLRARPGASNADVARELGVSRERVRQIRNRAALPKVEAPRCRACGAQAGPSGLCRFHRRRELAGIPLDAPVPGRRKACTDCGAAPAKVRGRCPRCARKADPVFHASETRRRAERAARAKGGAPRER